MNIVNCKVCNKQEKVSPSRFKNYNTCSHICSSIYRKNLTPNNCKCDQCSKEFHMKESQIKRYVRKMGTFCSMKCSGEFKKNYYLGSDNPNFKMRQYDQDGYRIVHYPKIGSIKEHHYITFNILNIKEIPEGYCVHHRDCNIYNNTPENLVLISFSDHRWIHTQYGNATLWAFSKNKISLKELISWSNDKERAKRLLQLNILKQSGVFKLGEFRETPEVDNPELSTDLNVQ